jgi:hypothetical protein
MNTQLHSIGIIIDGSYSSADYINSETIAFAESFGFDAGEPLDEDSEDYSQLLSETADEALSFLNNLELPSYCSYYFEDNSLFMSPDIDTARYDVGFVSSRNRAYPDDDYRGEWLEVNDHGNATLYVREDVNGECKDTEVWSIV